MTSFEDAQTKIKTFEGSPSNDQLLQLYSLFKQGTIGDCTIDRPGFLDFRGRAKWDAWKSLQGKSQENAKTEYIQLVESFFL